MAEQTLAELREAIFSKLPSAAEVNAKPHATPKHAMTTRLHVKAAKDKDDEKKLEQWKKDVGIRDKWTCRVCGIKTVKTMELDPKRGEAHHIAGRADKAVRYDVRNGLHCCLACHQKFTLGKLFISQIAKFLFKVGQKTYINGSKQVTFSERAA